jgi:hypothetical protein
MTQHLVCTHDICPVQPQGRLICANKKLPPVSLSDTPDPQIMQFPHPRHIKERHVTLQHYFVFGHYSTYSQPVPWRLPGDKLSSIPDSTQHDSDFKINHSEGFWNPPSASPGFLNPVQSLFHIAFDSLHWLFAWALFFWFFFFFA